MVRHITVIFICFVFITSCTSEAEKKERVVKYITRDMCKNISSKLNNSIEQNSIGDETVDALAMSIIGALDVPLEDFCHCFTDIMSKELSSKFSYKELLELRKDKIKQLMVASKLIEQRDIKADIENCLTGTLQKSGKEYEDYQKTLDDKFDN